MAEDKEDILYDDKHKFKLLRQINKGKGAFGDIYLTKNIVDNNEYAINSTNLQKVQELT